MHQSATRKLVDRALIEKETTLAEYVTQGRAQGKPLDEIWLDLRNLTDVPFTLRTLYRWAEEFAEVAS